MLCVPEQELNRPQIAGLLVNLRGLGPPHRVGPVSRAVETGALDPTVNDPSVLSCRDVRLIMKAAREEVLPVPWNAIGDPIADCCSGLFGDFELDRSAGFPLDHCGAVPDSAPDAHVVDLEPHEVTAPQLAVEGQIEQSEVASTLFELKPDADCPDLLWFQRALLADEAALVPGGTM
jgi:hypothetical protein